MTSFHGLDNRIRRAKEHKTELNRKEKNKERTGSEAKRLTKRLCMEESCKTNTNWLYEFNQLTTLIL